MTIAVGIEIYVKVEAIAAALWVVILSLQTHILPDVLLMLILYQDRPNIRRVVD